MASSSVEAPRIVVLGAGFAGVLAARRLAATAHSQGAQLVVVNPQDTFVERVRMHQVAAGQDIVRRPLRSMLDGTGATLLRGTVLAIDPARRELRVRGDDGEHALGYDYLLYALGSAPDTTTVPGAAEHALPVGSEPAARALAERVAALGKRGGRVVVCGGGLTGIELAAEIAEAYPALSVTLLTRGAFAEAFSPRGREHLARALARLRVTVRDEASIAEVRDGEVRLADRESVPFDLCAWAVSFTVPALAREAGLAVNARGQVLIDRCLRSVSHERVFAAGDAAMFAESPGAPIRMGCATAMPMAAAAADNLAAVMRAEAPTEFRYAYVAQFVSLGRRDALAQFTRADDSPVPLVLTGRVAAWMKDMTFRANVSALYTGIYPWQLLLLRRAFERGPAGLPPRAG